MENLEPQKNSGGGIGVVTAFVVGAILLLIVIKLLID
jgi:hypothetical protein